MLFNEPAVEIEPVCCINWAFLMSLWKFRLLWKMSLLYYTAGSISTASSIYTALTLKSVILLLLYFKNSSCLVKKDSHFCLVATGKCYKSNFFNIIPRERELKTSAAQFPQQRCANEPAVLKETPPPWRNFKYCPFHKTLWRSSSFVNWISVRYYEMDGRWNFRFLGSCCTGFRLPGWKKEDVERLSSKKRTVTQT